MHEFSEVIYTVGIRMENANVTRFCALNLGQSIAGMQ